MDNVQVPPVVNSAISCLQLTFTRRFFLHSSFLELMPTRLFLCTIYRFVFSYTVLIVENFVQQKLKDTLQALGSVFHFFLFLCLFYFTIMVQTNITAESTLHSAVKARANQSIDIGCVFLIWCTQESLFEENWDDAGVKTMMDIGTTDELWDWFTKVR